MAVDYIAPQKAYVPFSRMREILLKRSGKDIGDKVELNQINQQWDLRCRLIRAGVACKLFEGLTTWEQRKKGFRELIKLNRIADKVCGKRHGQPLTFGQLFEVVHREAL